MTELLELLELSVIDMALEEANVTNQVIQSLKDRFSNLRINGIDDKIGFNEVEDARKECKAVRVLATKICKQGREDALKTQRDWIAKEKEVVGEIESIELKLEAESNRIKEIQKQVLFEAAQREKLPVRKAKLATIDIEVADTELLKIDDGQFQQLFNEFHAQYLEQKEAEMKAKFQSEQKEAQLKAESERLEAKRIADEQAELQRQENEQLKKETAIHEAALAFEKKAAREKQEAIEFELQAQLKEAESAAKVEREKQEEILRVERKEREIAERKLQSIKDAEIAIENQRQADIKKAEKEAAKAAKAPIKEKLTKWVDGFTIEEQPAYNDVSYSIAVKFEAFKTWAKAEIEKI